MVYSVENIVNEPTVNFVGKDGFLWWVGEVEDNEDPMELGRVRTRVLGYYTNNNDGASNSLPTEKLPWATVMQHTSQAGNDGQGESSGQLQPGAIVMGFFMDGQSAQMPIVLGVLRVNKSESTQEKKTFVLTGETMQTGLGVNPASLPAGVATGQQFRRPGPGNNSVSIPGNNSTEAGGPGSPKNLGTNPGMPGSSANTLKARSPSKPIPAANGVGGPWKTLEYKLSYLIEDIADSAGALTKNEDGDFLDMINGKVVTAKQLTAKLGNFLTSIFTEVAAAVRAYISMLTDGLQGLLSGIGSATGIPMVVYTAIQGIVSQLLAALCQEDINFIQLAQEWFQQIVDQILSQIEKGISKAEIVLQTTNDMIQKVICQIEDSLNKLSKFITQIQSAVEAFSQAKEIVDSWLEAGSIFSKSGGLTEIFKGGIGTITSLIKLFLSFITGNCGRESTGGEDAVGYFPLFGVTKCTPEDLKNLEKFMGKSRGKCGSDGDPTFGAGSLLDSIFTEADPYLTSAKNYVNGAFDLFLGTPGRQSTVRRNENGTTHTSVKINNSEAAEHQAKAKMRAEKPDATDEEIENAVKKSKKKNAGKKQDDGNLIADHSSYAGNFTREVHGDDCETVDGAKVVNVEGDYHLKITGNCHIEVGGGFFFSAEGAPQFYDSKGEKQKAGKMAQKHTMRLGSDLDINVAGAKLAVSAADVELGANAMKLTSSNMELAGGATTISSGEVIITADNSIKLMATSLYELINTQSIIPAVKAGIFRTVQGSEHSILLPGGSASDAVPVYMVNNTAGPGDFQFSVTGCNIRAITGAMNINSVAGVTNITSELAMNIKSNLAMNLAVAGGPMKLTAAAIFLN